LCTYNGEKYLQEQLASIGSQTRLPDELIISDDGSHDGTMEIIKEYQANSSFPVILNRNDKQLGVVKNFENAISLCRGDIIFLCDQDDYWYAEKLKTIEAIFIQTKCGMVFTNAEIVDESLNPLGYSLFTPYRCSPNYFGKKEQMELSYNPFKFLLKHNILTGATMAFRSSYKDIILPIPPIWDHDRWIGIIITAQSAITFLSKLLIKYRQHGKNEVGGPQRKVSGLLTKARKRGQKYYQNEIIKIETLYNRLLQHSGEKEIFESLKYLEEYLKYLYSTSNLPKNLFYRLPYIIKSLLNGNYLRYSCGWQQVGLDMFFYQ